MKRAFDLIVVSVGLVLLSPVMLVVAALVRIRLGGPVLFRQKRGGFRNKPIEIYKFRTMKELYDADGVLLPDAQRLTPLGSWLRKTSLDELPTLFNVLRGEMSLVGPRPLLYRYIERYTPEQIRRHDVKPGITGWAQVHGRNAISWEEKFALDVWYVDHQSFWLDLKILGKTVAVILFRKGVNASQGTTMPEFMGTFSDAVCNKPASGQKNLKALQLET